MRQREILIDVLQCMCLYLMVGVAPTSCTFLSVCFSGVSSFSRQMLFLYGNMNVLKPQAYFDVQNYRPSLLSFLLE